MAQRANEYQRLPGRGARFEGARFIAGRRKSCSLWLGPDHVLGIESAGFTEDYKRFYYRDIQSLIIRKTANGKAWNWVLSILAAIPMVVAIAGLSSASLRTGDRDWVWFGIWGGISVVFLLLLVINWLRGPTCVTHLKTAVQTDQLASLNRLRNAEKVLERLRAPIEEAQGLLGPTEAQMQVESLLHNAFNQSTSNSGSTLHYTSVAGPSVQPYASRTHQILFTLILADGMVSFLQIFFNSVPLVLATTFLSLGCFGMIIVALMKQYQTDLQPFIRGWTWASAVFYTIEMFGSYVAFVGMAAGNPEMTQNQWKLMKHFAEISPLEKPWLFGLLTVSGLVAVILGGIGLLSLRNFARKRQSSAVTPPAISEIPAQPPLS